MAEKNINLTSLGKAPYPKKRMPAVVHESHKRVAEELISGGSIELSSGRPEQIAEASDLLPYGMSVFVPILLRHSLMSRLDIISKLRNSGFDPVPHLAARRIPSRKILQEFLLRSVRQSGVHRVLLIGGDSGAADGPYEDSAAVLHDGVLAESGIKEIGVAGYPEGHPRISGPVLKESLQDKLKLASDQGLGMHIVTQFSFVPTRIIDYCAALGARLPNVPVYVGIAGPTSPSRLIHFARYCGVSASLAAVGKIGVKVVQFTRHSRADEQLNLLASYCASHGASNVVGVHMYSFGGFGQTAQWVHDHCGVSK